MATLSRSPTLHSTHSRTPWKHRSVTNSLPTPSVAPPPPFLPFKSALPSPHQFTTDYAASTTSSTTVLVSSIGQRGAESDGKRAEVVERLAGGTPSRSTSRGWERHWSGRGTRGRASRVARVAAQVQRLRSDPGTTLTDQLSSFLRSLPLTPFLPLPPLPPAGQRWIHPRHLLVRFRRHRR